MNQIAVTLNLFQGLLLLNSKMLKLPKHQDSMTIRIVQHKVSGNLTVTLNLKMLKKFSMTKTTTHLSNSFFRHPELVSGSFQIRTKKNLRKIIFRRFFFVLYLSSQTLYNILYTIYILKVDHFPISICYSFHHCFTHSWVRVDGF